MDYILNFDDNVIKYEKDNNWKKAVDIVYQKWKKNPLDLNSLLCAGTEIWYSKLIISNYEYEEDHQNYVIPLEDTIDEYLMEITNFGFNHFLDNSIFNAYFGYMIKVMPYFFKDYNGDYDGWQQKGICMMKNSYLLDPQCPFTKAMFYETYNKDTYYLYANACKELWERTPLNQWGTSEVCQYFFRILNGNCNN